MNPLETVPAALSAAHSAEPSADELAAAAAAAEAANSGCSGGESFALRVLGDDMLPEFKHGEIITVEPDGALKDGSFVLAELADGWSLRQLRSQGSVWELHALNPSAARSAAVMALADLSSIHGVVIQKTVPGRRRLNKFYT